MSGRWEDRLERLQDRLRAGRPLSRAQRRQLRKLVSRQHAAPGAARPHKLYERLLGPLAVLGPRWARLYAAALSRLDPRR